MCCDVILSTGDYCNQCVPSFVCGRTMEFVEDLESCIKIIPRGMRFSSTTPSYVLEWISRYGYASVNVLGTNIAVDGMNEEGLSCGVLAMDSTEYTVHTGKSISILDVCSFVLGTCRETREAVSVLQKMQFYGEMVPKINRVIGMHIIIHDRSGNSMLIQISKNGVRMYCPDGVVTNGPHYHAHKKLLKEFRLELGTNPGIQNRAFSDENSSTSRFIKLSELKRVCIPERANGVVNSTSLLKLLYHMFNRVDIIKGTCVSNRESGEVYPTTQWCLFKDLSRGMLYYKSYDNPNLKSVNLSEIDFSQGIPKESFSTMYFSGDGKFP